jgi:histidyl-tRNA synthetase
MTIKAPRGTRDILPGESERWALIEGVARTLFSTFGFREIRTPIFEELELFTGGIGEATDIVEKEMFTLEKGDTTYALRPEATASVVRAYLEHNLDKERPFQKLFYIGPMFRYERPQAARLRQFHQIGVEALGASDPLLDVEVIEAGAHFFDAIGLKRFEIQLNTLGCESCRSRHREALRAFFASLKTKLCEDCDRRFERNVFRLLDCKNESCKALRAEAPLVLDLLCLDCKAHFETVQLGLRAIDRPFHIEPTLVRGLDYYVRTVFEYVHPLLGARSAIGGGGRYELRERLGGSPLNSCGFAIGFEATLLAVEKEELTLAPQEDLNLVFVATNPSTLRLEAFKVATQLRKEGIKAELDYEARSLKAQMRAANRLQVRFVLLMLQDVWDRSQVRLKRMDDGTEEDLSLEEALSRIKASRTALGEAAIS